MGISTLSRRQSLFYGWNQVEVTKRCAIFVAGSLLWLVAVANVVWIVRGRRRRPAQNHRGGS